jgi:hypothetical protein
LEYVPSIFSNLSELLVPLLGWSATDACFEAAYEEAGIDLDCRATTAFAQLEVLEFKTTASYRWTKLVHLYAYWGLEAAPDGSLQWERDLASDVLPFRENSGTGFLQLVTSPGDLLADALRAAVARYIVDSGDAPTVTPTELAALARLDIKTLRNSLTPSGRRKSGLSVDPNGNITRESAKTWLLARQDFLPTISAPGKIAATEHVEVMGEQSHIVFIPTAEDGSAFTPDVCREGKYYVEATEGEVALDSYADALAILSVMTVPKWRRPTPEGRWGQVRGNAWRRTTKAALGISELRN